LLELGQGLRLRPATDADRELLFAVYSAARAEELALAPWDDATKLAFLNHQFQTQDSEYKRTRPDAAYDVILVDGAEAGRLYLHRTPEELVVVDVALLPEFRNRGIGSRLMRSVMEEAAASGTPVTLHVEHFNRARGLYDRLGFRELDRDGVYALMEWTAAS
jgi:ribosomal protein S18 acetylase RimI-like enzyme